MVYVFSDDSPSFLKFLGVELTRGYILEHDEEQYTARREKVYSFAKIPTETEKFMAYGFFQVIRLDTTSLILVNRN